MKPGDLVRINLPERARGLPSYYYHNYVGFLVESGLGVEVWREPGVSRETDGGLQLWSQVLLGGRLVWTTTGMLYDMEGNKL